MRRIQDRNSKETEFLVLTDLYILNKKTLKNGKKNCFLSVF